MKALFFAILLSLNLFATQAQQSLLDTISQYAIQIGNGELRNIHVFVDPECPFSRAYIQKITEEDNRENSYYFYLYRLDILDSEMTIQYIYQSKDAKRALIEVMVVEQDLEEDLLFNFEVREETLEIVNKVAQVAKKLEVDRRPHIFTFDSVSNP
ncbi:MAG: hypothetical protein U9Q40_02315 [Campylobacterota bacterium]|nr:hypothetical protein [Campylobacterota bacterium]